MAKKKSKRFRLNQDELMAWVQNTLMFSSPAILAFLIALQSGSNVTVAAGMAYQALVAAAIDLTRKFTAGRK